MWEDFLLECQYWKLNVCTEIIIAPKTSSAATNTVNAVQGRESQSHHFIDA